MSHWAEIDANNIVLRVTVGSNADTDQQAYQWIVDNLGGDWKQTSYNGKMRKNYAGIGYAYDAVRDAFIAPQPFPSWVLNEQTCRWEAPVPMPTDGKMYSWDESTLNWIESV